MSTVNPYQFPEYQVPAGHRRRSTISGNVFNCIAPGTVGISSVYAPEMQPPHIVDNHVSSSGGVGIQVREFDKRGLPEFWAQTEEARALISAEELKAYRAVLDQLSIYPRSGIPDFFDYFDWLCARYEGHPVGDNLSKALDGVAHWRPFNARS